MKVIEDRIYGFMAESQIQADAALFIERAWKSRAEGFKISKKVYDQMANFVTSTALQSKSGHEFFSRLLSRYGADSARPIFDNGGVIVPAAWYKKNQDEDGLLTDIVEKTVEAGKETTFLRALNRYPAGREYANLRSVLIHQTQSLIILIREKAEYTKLMENEK